MTAALNLASEYLGALSKDQLVGRQAMDLSHALNRMQMVAAPVIREVIKCIHDYGMIPLPIKQMPILNFITVTS